MKIKIKNKLIEFKNFLQFKEISNTNLVWFIGIFVVAFSYLWNINSSGQFNSWYLKSNLAEAKLKKTNWNYIINIDGKDYILNTLTK
ncbi:MAG: hypothetical protein ACD_49C00067G0012 [uncultured bacterium (gcode 4)]|uniref:Uncharacterized protein n=1 Tax=uncultured bacterium (gcode 4) TaxID=1234023 RepID=K2AWE9_9BACT|nr:MAG: hypothetical protein ACD_49C00067G0012 [uncultured bacterium (gcode 4)]